MSETLSNNKREKNTSITCSQLLQVEIGYCNMKLFKCPQKFNSVYELRVNQCTSLTSFHLGHHLRSLEKLFLGHCENLESLGGLDSLISLRRLSIVSCPRLKMSRMQDNGGASNLLPLTLVSPKIKKCHNVVSVLFGSLQGLISLSDLTIESCPGLQSLDNLLHLKALSNLYISDCPDLTSMGNLKSLTFLRILRILRCPKLATSCQGRQSETLSSSIINLTIDLPSLLAMLLQKEGLTSLQVLFIAYSPQDTPFTTEQEEMFRYLTSLTDLYFYSCENLLSLPSNLKKLNRLKKMMIEYCPKIESLPDLPHFLESLKIYGCQPQLTAQQQK